LTAATIGGGGVGEFGRQREAAWEMVGGVDPTAEHRTPARQPRIEQAELVNTKTGGRWRSSPSAVLARAAELAVGTHSSKPGVAEFAEPKPRAPRAPPVDEPCGLCRAALPCSTRRRPVPPTPPLLRPPAGESCSPQRQRVRTGLGPSSLPLRCCSRHLEMLQSMYIDVVINVPFHADVLMSQSLNCLGCCKCLSTNVAITAN
jgi:hypothetical protein